VLLVFYNFPQFIGFFFQLSLLCVDNRIDFPKSHVKVQYHISRYKEANTTRRYINLLHSPNKYVRQNSAREVEECIREKKSKKESEIGSHIDDVINDRGRMSELFSVQDSYADCIHRETAPPK
jgi:hypothetical protein